MPKLEHGELGTDSPGAREAADGSPVRVFVMGAIAIVAIIAALLTVIRVFLFPVWEANSEGARQVATAQVQLAAAMTQEAISPKPASTVQPTATVRTVNTPTSAISATARPIASATAAPISERATPVAAPAASISSLPTPTADQAAEIAAAYKKYFDVRSEALLNLDTSALDDVAAGQSLAGLEETIADDRANGKALQTNVEHEQVYVTGYRDDHADVADQYRDSSIYVDPDTHLPLPGQVAPTSPDLAPEVDVVYHLQKIDGVWKVVSGERFVPEGT